MRIAVIGGAGGMGSVTTRDAATSEGVERVILVDRDAALAHEVASAYANVEVRAPREGPQGLRDALSGADAVVNAATHRLNVSAMEAWRDGAAHDTRTDSRPAQRPPWVPERKPSLTALHNYAS